MLLSKTRDASHGKDAKFLHNRQATTVGGKERPPPLLAVLLLPCKEAVEHEKSIQKQYNCSS